MEERYLWRPRASTHERILAWMLWTTVTSPIRRLNATLPRQQQFVQPSVEFPHLTIGYHSCIVRNQHKTNQRKRWRTFLGRGVCRQWWAQPASQRMKQGYNWLDTRLQAQKDHVGMWMSSVPSLARVWTFVVVFVFVEINYMIYHSYGLWLTISHQTREQNHRRSRGDWIPKFSDFVDIKEIEGSRIEDEHICYSRKLTNFLLNDMEVEP